MPEEFEFEVPPGSVGKGKTAEELAAMEKAAVKALDKPHPHAEGFALGVIFSAVASVMYVVVRDNWRSHVERKKEKDGKSI